MGSSALPVSLQSKLSFRTQGISKANLSANLNMSVISPRLLHVKAQTDPVDCFQPTESNIRPLSSAMD
jgi:hypothetical protein